MQIAHALRARKSRSRLAAAAVIAPLAALLGVTGTAFTGSANAATSTVDIFADTLQPTTAAVTSSTSVNLGMKFSSDNAGSVVALQFYRSAKQTKAYGATLWNNGVAVATTTFPASTQVGWQTATLNTPYSVNKGRVYTVSYLASDGQYAQTPGALGSTVSNDGLNAHGSVHANGASSTLPTTSGKGTSFMLDVVFSATGGSSASTPTATPTTAPTTSTPSARPTTTATPTASPTTAPSVTPSAAPTVAPTQAPSATPSTAPTSAPSSPTTTGWPGAANTGVPAGTSLTTYTGPMTIRTANTVIRNQIVNGTLNIQAPGVQIINTRINGGVDLRDPKNNNYSFTIVDSEIHIGDNLNTGLMRGNFHANRVEVTGGRRSMYCQYNCVIENSWVHSQGGDPGGDAHFSGIRMEQNGTIRHNTITCEAQRGSGTGCSAGLTGYGDFAPVQNNLIENNYFYGGGGGRSTVCAYGGSSGDNGSKPYGNQASNIRFINNVFVKGSNGHCGNLGTVLSFDASRPGNVWSGNTWDDGTTYRP